MENIPIENTKETIIRRLNNFLVNLNNLSTNSSIAKYNISLAVKCITQTIRNLKCDSHDAIFEKSLENNLCKVTDYKWSTLNKELVNFKKIKNNIQTKTIRKNKIEHHFNIMDKQLQLEIKKKMLEIKSENIILAAMKEHEHRKQNLELNLNNYLLKIESNTKNNEMEKNNQLLIRNDLKSKKAQIVKSYDSDMMEKHEKVNELNLKIKMIEDSIYQLQELISDQMPIYDEVILEKELENDRIWHEQLLNIQRNIAARKIQIQFRKYLNYIKTRDSKKNKKGQHKKLQPKIKSV